MATSSTPGLPQDDDLWLFLRKRGVPEESIQKMQQDHIDISLIGDIDDAIMASYIPAYGGSTTYRDGCDVMAAERFPRSVQSERDLLSTALKEAVVGDDEEELLDLMDRMGVITVPTQDNLRAVLVQVAHKQMIQHPKYALENIAEVARPILREFFPSVEDMKKLYEDIKPTT
ncbi:uncharacterized protein V6R79_019180 [Siganus canaliculatus]